MQRLGLCLCVGLSACGGDDAALDTESPVTAGDTTGGTTDGPTGPGSSATTDGGADTNGTESSSGPNPDTTATATGDSSESGDPPPMALPPVNAGLDYQLGGAYPPPAGVEIVSRDRNASPEPGLYNICYVNGYQTQPDEEEWWLSEHPDLILRDENGDPVIDPDWDEMLLDISTPEKRDALAEIVGGWITDCGTDGFDAIEIDNLDTYARSDGLISEDNAVAFMSMLSAIAHGEGLAIAQKNSTEILDRQPELGTDFAVAEECNRYSECADYMDVYGDQVYVIEYRQQDFDAGCTDFPELSIVLRDLDLVPEGQGAYVFDGC
jgi:hypothetical protein